ncbi:MAG: hypothetical protein JHC79_20130, partial [Williamsia sp.]|nr:hypothetical protein [Williamsia sp.]
MRFIAVGDRVASIVSAHCGDREVVRKKYDTASPPPDCTDLIDDIRAAHYDPDAGTFLLATITGRTIRDFSVRTETFESAPPPQWAEITTADIVAESRRYPRNSPPAWWTDILTRNASIDIRPRPGTATTFEISEFANPPQIRAQFVTLWCAVAHAVGAIYPRITTGSDHRRVTVDHLDHHFTIAWFDDGRAVISGRDEKYPRQGSVEDLFIGAPDWIRSDLLDEPTDLDALTFCAWHDDAIWAHSPAASTEAVLEGVALFRTPAHGAYSIIYTMYADVREIQGAKQKWFDYWYPFLSVKNTKTVKPKTGAEWIEHLDTRPPERGPAEIDDAIDYLGSWDLLAPLGLTGDDGPTIAINNHIATIQKILGDNEVRVSLAGGAELLRWKNPPDDTTAEQIRTQLRRLRQLMFRRDTGIWWDAEFTPTAAHFTDPGQRPERTLPPGAYADDLHRMSAPTPGWLHDLFLSQTIAVLEPTPATPAPVTGLDPFPAIAGRWAALAGATFALASDDERRSNSLPIRAAMDGLWYTTGEG